MLQEYDLCDQSNIINEKLSDLHNMLVNHTR